MGVDSTKPNILFFMDGKENINLSGVVGTKFYHQWPMPCRKK